jgi:endonuclease G
MANVGWTVILTGAVLWLTGCNMLQLPTLLAPPTVNSVHLMLGNPSKATTSTDNADDYLMLKPQYALSYNNHKHTANWASWQLNASWLGSVPRNNNFRPDDSLPQGWYAVVPADYNNSGFDRGHMTPSGDRSNNPTDNAATFLMTNILPQAPDNNQGPWERLEIYCRSLAKQGKELYIVAGGYGQKKLLPKAEIVAPLRTWKVIVVLDHPGQGVQDITEQTRVIAVDLPNVQGIKATDWHTYRVSVRQIEAKTGYNFLSNVPIAIQNVLETRVDNQ